MGKGKRKYKKKNVCNKDSSNLLQNAKQKMQVEKKKPEEARNISEVDEHKKIKKNNNCAEIVKKSWKNRKIKIKLKQMTCKLKNFYVKRDFRVIIIIVLTFLFFISGLALYINNTKQVPHWAVTPPLILFASDRPLKGLWIYSSTDENGVTKLYISEQEHESEESHIWVYLNSLEDVPINWEIQERHGNIENYQINETYLNGFMVEKTNKFEGASCETVFEITFGEDYWSMAEVVISEPDGRALYRGNGFARPRLPWISPWHSLESANDYAISTSIHELNKQYENVRFDSADLLKLSINNMVMYAPILRIDTDYKASQIEMLQELELRTVGSKPKTEYPMLSWSSNYASYPVVEFRDLKWERNIKRDNMLGGILVGLGINILFILINFKSDKDRDNND